MLLYYLKRLKRVMKDMHTVRVQLMRLLEHNRASIKRQDFLMIHTQVLELVHEI